MTAARKRLSPILLLLAASLGTAALIESCYECFGLDGDPIHIVRVSFLGALAAGCAAVLAALVFESCSRCDGRRYRAHLQRDIFDRLPFFGKGLRFTAVVALLHAVCMASIQLGDSAPNAGEDLIGWATSLLLLIIGTIVVRCILRLMPRLAQAIVVLFIGVARPRQAARALFISRSRPIAGYNSMPRVMYKRPPPRPVHA